MTRAASGPGTFTIAPTSPLPAITEAVIIDATSPYGFGGPQVIELNGASAGANAVGLNLSSNAFTSSSGSTIRGLVINRFDGTGLEVRTHNNVIAGNFVGTDASGTVDLGNRNNGIYIAGDNNLIGGVTAADRNIVSGNDDEGIDVGGSATGNIIIGNYIGTDVNGTAGLGNGNGSLTTGGIKVEGDGNQIGGTLVGQGNLISGNDGFGLHVVGTLNSIRGNFVGTNAAGDAALTGTQQVGVQIDSANNTVGGLVPEARNVVSGNTTAGILITGLSASGNMVQGNYVGLAASGAAAVGNGGAGVRIADGAFGNTIGGTDSGARNVVSGNTNDALHITTNAHDNVIQGNYIGTDAAGMSAVANTFDAVDIDTGAYNNLIGGTAAGAGNVLSGNGDEGLDVDGTVSPVYGNVIQGNLIGLAADGITALGNGSDAVYLNEARDNVVGGTTPEARNVIADNSGNGVLITGSPVHGQPGIEGNYIGTDCHRRDGARQRARRHRAAFGCQQQCDRRHGRGAGNVISGNAFRGSSRLDLAAEQRRAITLFRAMSSALRPTATQALANLYEGIRIEDGLNHVVGGAVTGAGNVISGNGRDGISIKGGSGHIIEGNLIGTDGTGTSALANQDDGINLVDSTGNRIGGATAEASNLVSGNTGTGIYLGGLTTYRQHRPEQQNRHRPQWQCRPR